MTTAERVTWALSAAVFLPALAVGGGFFIAIGAAVLVLGGYYGSRYGARIYEKRQMGAKSGNFDVNRLVNGSGNDGRRRE